MLSSILILLNIFILEALLSVDNAAVLAIMVKDLPENQRSKALQYGIFGALFFRGLSLFFVAFLIKILWLKIVGGGYLLWLVYSHFTPQNDSVEEISDKGDSKIFRFFNKAVGLSMFWSTVILVEIMDMAFSIDNIFAAVAMTKNFTLIIVGVILGIIAMRFIAGWFSKLIEKHPSLEKSAFIVIALLGLKLIAAGTIDMVFSEYGMWSYAKAILDNHVTDFVFSGIMMLIFFVPLLSKKSN